MKKLFIATLFAASLFSSAFAADANKVNRRTINTFQYEFKGATNVEWDVKSNFSKASFTVGGENVQAFFDTEGTLIGTSRSLTVDKLPTDVKRAFAKKYSNYEITESIKFDDVDNTSYYISANNENEVVILKITNGSFSVFKKNSK